MISRNGQGPIDQFSRDRIKNRLLKRATQVWGFQETAPEEFDPLVHLLIEACAVEFEKTYQEIHNVQGRMIERLSLIMTPAAVYPSRPCHAVLNVRAAEGQTTLRKTSQFFVNRLQPIAGPDKSKGICFSPAAAFRVFNARIRFQADAAVCYEIREGRKIPAFSLLKTSSGSNTLWLGLEVSEKVKSLNQLLFHFDWPGDSRKEEYYAYLGVSKWFLHQNQLRMNGGLPVTETGGTFDAYFDYSRQIELETLRFYSRSFLHLESGLDTGDLENTTIPPELNALFAEKDKPKLPSDLLWIKVVFPDSLTFRALHSIHCSVNSFPVINRELNDINWELKPPLTIVPLAVKDKFLAIETVSDADGEYINLPLTLSKNMTARTYSLNTKGISRFDQRSATEFTAYLTELLKDESAAFTALGSDFLATLLKELNQSIALLEQRADSRSHDLPLPYLLVKSDSKENLLVSYWSTLSAEANRIPAGTRIITTENAPVIDGESMLITATFGGQDEPGSEEKINIYRKNLLTRGRVVTREDIRFLCLAELGTLVKKVTVEKKIRTGELATQGFFSCFEVTLFANDARRLSQEEWSNVRHELNLTLESQSSGLIPFVIILSTDGPVQA